MLLWLGKSNAEEIGLCVVGVNFNDNVMSSLILGGANRNDKYSTESCGCRAATFAEKDHMTNVSENIMLGQLAPIGTGSFQLLLDDERLEDAIEVQLGAAFDPFGMGAMTPSRMTPGRSPGMTPSRMSPSGAHPSDHQCPCKGVNLVDAFVVREFLVATHLFPFLS